MSDGLKNHMRLASLMAAQWKVALKYGTVTSYDPDNFCVKATLQPEGSETGWLPIVTLQVGNGWGVFAAPNIGDQIAIQFQEGEVEAGAMIGAVASVVDRNPSVPAGEIWLVHESGAAVKLTADGKLLLNSTEQVSVGDVMSPLYKLIDERAAAIFNAHTHDIAGVQAGSDAVVSDPPNSTIDAGQMTAITKAN